VTSRPATVLPSLPWRRRSKSSYSFVVCTYPLHPSATHLHSDNPPLNTPPPAARVSAHHHALEYETVRRQRCKCALPVSTAAWIFTTTTTCRRLWRARIRTATGRLFTTAAASTRPSAESVSSVAKPVSQSAATLRPATPASTVWTATLRTTTIWARRAIPATTRATRRIRLCS
jgi:hypothetical protein